MFETPLSDVPQRALTGALPPESQVGRPLHEAHARYSTVAEGTVADYIPALAEADPAHFGLALTEVDGTVHRVGDTAVPFTIQSISKAFVFALVVEAIGHEEVHRVVGVNNTGLPFNSVIALELNQGSPMNPMVNAGAIATTALMPGADAEAKWLAVVEGLSRFAGRSLELDARVLRSESETNHRNQGIADLLASYGRLRGRSEDVVDIYTRQCSLLVTAEDLATMGATLADGGLNPVTGEQVVSAEVCRDTLSVLAACGMYELSGDWQFEIVLPAKSGVSGGIVAIAPGKGALGAYSPPLDRAGSSVRAQRACAHLSRSLGLNLFASRPTVFVTATVVVRFYSRFSPRTIALFSFTLTTLALLWLAVVVTNNWETLPTILGLVAFGIGQGALVTLVFNVLVTAVPKELAGDVGSLRGTTQNLASAVGTAVMGAVLVMVLGAGITRAAIEHPELPPELVAQVDLDQADFVSNDELREVLSRTTADEAQVEEAVTLNEEQRLRTLKIGFLILAGLSAVAALPASRLPAYRSEEIPDPQPERR